MFLSTHYGYNGYNYSMNAVPNGINDTKNESTVKVRVLNNNNNNNNNDNNNNNINNNSLTCIVHAS